MIDVRDASSDHPGNIGWILVYKKAICQGYTLLFNAFMNELGIESLHLSSDSMNHAWNLVHMDDDHWYHIDVTWDSPSELDDVKYYSTFDFLRNDEGITEVGHRDWRAIPYCLDTPAADGTYYEENVDHDVCKPVPLN